MAVNSIAANSPRSLQGYSPRFTSAAPGQIAPDQGAPSETTGDPAVTISDEARLRQSAQGPGELTPGELKVVESLKRRDAEVRTHEQSHAAAAGQYAIGGINLQFRTGPDGRKYAVAGDVRIDTSEVAGDPEATVRKMAAIRRAALAPASPSSQDRRVAARAAQLETEARIEVQQAPEEGDDASQAAKTEGSEADEGKQTGSGQAAENDRQEREGEGGNGPAQASGAFGPEPGGRNDIAFRRAAGTGQAPGRENGTGSSQVTLSTESAGIRVENYGRPAPLGNKGSLINISG